MVPMPEVGPVIASIIIFAVCIANSLSWWIVWKRETLDTFK
ncbi:hypothetical protein A33Q_3522 [Indibacter alkaliphilus LW1]|uniref:Uncharacterized protein n=1 Tax=Indibacter alkaliphilus (strain CCUG 57479 / KCTC 22604 / LW1) TaxID=1189612 RepID=S2DNR9_INDAL|nr:hypothetical protein A33Q_3522 [Indibacter alkaliphilus LW1]